MNIKEEIIFWTGILRDHTEFMLNDFAFTENNYIEKTEAFKKLFNKIHNDTLNAKVIERDDILTTNKIIVSKFINFQKNILKDLLTCKVNLAMTPTFLNHMINEAMEFYIVIRILEQSRSTSPLETLKLHKVWLPDAAGHAKAIASQLDGIEDSYINTAMSFVDRFDKLFKKAFEMYIMYERTSLANGNLSLLNKEIEVVMNDFILFLKDIENNRKTCSIHATGTFKPLILNHMMREEKYYLERIKQLVN